MTILLYEYEELAEKYSKGYKLWKGCHITSYVLATVFGLLNFYFLFISNQTFGGQCVLDPHELVFKLYVPADDGVSLQLYNETVEIVNVTALNNTNTTTEDSSPVLVLDLQGSQFQRANYCELALYTPILSAIFGITWCTLFTMCSAGGRGKRGMPEPWRILAPALVFALVFVFFTGHNFFVTNGGIQALCGNFSVATNTTACSRSIDEHMPRAGAGWARASLALGVTRAACAGVLACWACACALLLARCLLAPDFQLRRIEVVVHADPGKKLQPLLKKSEKRKKVTINPNDIHNSLNGREDSAHSIVSQNKLEDPTSVSARDNDSLNSEPTLSSELPTVSFSHPEGRSLNFFDPKSEERPRNENIELAYSPKKLL